MQEYFLYETFRKGIDCLHQSLASGIRKVSDSRKGELIEYFRQLEEIGEQTFLTNHLVTENYQKLVALMQILEGVIFSRISIKDFVKLGGKPDRTILLNVISKKPPCPYCDWWVKRREYALILSSSSVPAFEFNYDWQESPNTITICLTGLCKDLTCFPAIIFRKDQKAYICQDIWTRHNDGLLPNPYLSLIYESDFAREAILQRIYGI